MGWWVYCVWMAKEGKGRVLVMEGHEVAVLGS